MRLVLAAHALPHLSADAELLGSELVTNAVTHTKGPVALRVRWPGGGAAGRGLGGRVDAARAACG